MKNGVPPTISHLDIHIPFSPLSHTQKAAGEMSYTHTGSRSSLGIETQETKVTNITRQGGSEATGSSIHAISFHFESSFSELFIFK